MVQPESKVIIADNSGAKIGRVFKILGSSKKRYARIGERLILSVQKAEPRKQVKKKDILCAVVIRQNQAFRRKDGSYIKFDENAVVIVNKDNGEPIANRIFGPVPRELSEMGYQKIVSIASEII